MKPFGPVRLAAALGFAAICTSAPAGGNAGDPGQRRAALVGQTAQGNASFYSPRLRDRKTASGEPYDPSALTAAHRTLPLGTKVQVINPKNGRSVVVTINDRGPVPKGRMLDVSGAAADALGMKKAGVTRVRTEIVEPDDP